MALTADQVYLLNTLAYMRNSEFVDNPQGKTVKEFIQEIKNGDGTIDAISNHFQSEEQIESICDQILQDETLSSMTFEHASQTEGGANCFVITTPEGAGERQAVVVFEGTTGGVEWRDNFEGGTTTDEADGVSTNEQVKVLEWYQSDEIQRIVSDCDKVTVSGHSKGGNKAKYLTLMDDSIDECISYDGQGFSDEFVNEYSSEIMRNQHKITNYNKSDDYVNILLNDVGEIHYIKGIDTDFFTNHSLFSMYQSIPLSEHYTKQSELLAEADQLLNSFLRSLDQDEKEIFLEMLGELTADCLGGDHEWSWDDARDYIDMLKNQGGWDVLGKFLDHLISYASYELAERIIGMLKDLFPFLSPWLNDLLKKVKEKGGMPDGSDIRLGNAADHILLDTDVLSALMSQLRTLCSELNRCAGEISACAAEVEEAHISVKGSLSIFFSVKGMVTKLGRCLTNVMLRSLSKNANSLGSEAEEISQRIRQLVALAEETEKENAALIPDPGHRPSPFTH